MPTHHSVIATTGPTPIDKLRPHPDNPNNGDTDAIQASLLHNGQYRPIVARVDGTILAGHHVYEAAMGLEWTHLDVTFVDVDDVTASRIMVADNRIAELGAGVDLGLLMPLLEALADTDDGLDGTGYAPEDMDNIATLLDHGVWTPDDDTTAAGATTDDTSFWPKITLQVPPATFDAWRSLLDSHEGDNDVAKLTMHLRASGFLVLEDPPA